MKQVELSFNIFLSKPLEKSIHCETSHSRPWLVLLCCDFILFCTGWVLWMADFASPKPSPLGVLEFFFVTAFEKVKVCLLCKSCHYSQNAILKLVAHWQSGQQHIVRPCCETNFLTSFSINWYRTSLFLWTLAWTRSRGQGQHWACGEPLNNLQHPWLE